MDFPLKAEVHAKASSYFTLEMVEARLRVLAGQESDEARQEIAFLNRVKLKKFPESVVA